MEHYCDLRDLDYLSNRDGVLYRIVCKVCRRAWSLTIKTGNNGRSIGFWNAYPHCQPVRHVTQWPMDPPEVQRARQEEWNNTRQARLNQLDRIAKDREAAISEAAAAMARVDRDGKGPRQFAYAGARRAGGVVASPHGGRGAVRQGSPARLTPTFTKVSIFNSLSAQTQRLRSRLDDR